MFIYRIFFAVMMIFIFSSCSEPTTDQTSTAGSSPVYGSYPAPAPKGVWDPDKPTPYPVYDLPPGWKQYPENSHRSDLETADGKGLKLTIGALSRPGDIKTVEQWRNQRYSQIYCPPSQEVQDNWLNCSKGFQKSLLSIAGKQVFILQYYGVMGDSEVPVAELFWQGENTWPEVLLVEGDFSKAQNGISTLIQSLHYQYKIPSDSFINQ